MRSFVKLSGLLLLLLLSITSCKGYQWSGSSSSSCSSSFLAPTTQCTITFTPSNTFNWTASSTVSGVTIQPSSGKQAAGASSGNIHVTLPSDACPASSGAYAGSLNFTDEARDWMLSFSIVGSGGSGCALKS